MVGYIKRHPGGRGIDTYEIFTTTEPRKSFRDRRMGCGEGRRIDRRLRRNRNEFSLRSFNHHRQSFSFPTVITAQESISREGEREFGQEL